MYMSRLRIVIMIVKQLVAPNHCCIKARVLLLFPTINSEDLAFLCLFMNHKCVMQYNEGKISLIVSPSRTLTSRMEIALEKKQIFVINRYFSLFLNSEQIVVKYRGARRYSEVHRSSLFMITKLSGLKITLFVVGK